MSKKVFMVATISLFICVVGLVAAQLWGTEAADAGPSGAEEQIKKPTAAEEEVKKPTQDERIGAIEKNQQKLLSELAVIKKKQEQIEQNQKNILKNQENILQLANKIFIYMKRR